MALSSSDSSEIGSILGKKWVLDLWLYRIGIEFWKYTLKFVWFHYCFMADIKAVYQHSRNFIKNLYYCLIEMVFWRHYTHNNAPTLLLWPHELPHSTSGWVITVGCGFWWSLVTGESRCRGNNYINTFITTKIRWNAVGNLRWSVTF